jgi:hypothetical protein
VGVDKAARLGNSADWKLAIAKLEQDNLGLRSKDER